MVQGGSWSGKKVEKLGKRLVAAKSPADEDIDLLHQLLLTYDAALAEAVERIQVGTGLQPTSRLKNTGTILEKLRRHGGHTLKVIQDLAGIRIVEDLDLSAQDELVSRLAGLFDGPPKIIDRRADPRQGYRAVHLVVSIGKTPVEIQVRTLLQHEWANMFEKLADVVGRGIRYGEPHDDWFYGLKPEMGRLLKQADDPGLADWLEKTDSIVTMAVEAALRLAGVIHGYEVARSLVRHPERLSSLPEAQEYLNEKVESLTELQGLLEESFSAYGELISHLVQHRSLATETYEVLMSALEHRYQDIINEVVAEAPDGLGEDVVRELLKALVKSAFAKPVSDGSVES